MSVTAAVGPLFGKPGRDGQCIFLPMSFCKTAHTTTNPVCKCVCV